MTVRTDKSAVNVPLGIRKSGFKFIHGKIRMKVDVNGPAVNEPEIDAAYQHLIFQGQGFKPVQPFFP